MCKSGLGAAGRRPWGGRTGLGVMIQVGDGRRGERGRVEKRVESRGKKGGGGWKGTCRWIWNGNRQQ